MNPFITTAWYSALNDLATGMLQLWFSPYTWSTLMFPHFERQHERNLIQLTSTEVA